MKEMLLALLLLIIGFVLLIKGADFFVDGSSSVAKRLKVPSMIIGLTIVAMGTSLPECAVSVTASLNNNNALAVSNVIGSNIFNLIFHGTSDPTGNISGKPYRYCGDRCEDAPHGWRGDDREAAGKWLPGKIYHPDGLQRLQVCPERTSPWCQ